MTKTKHVLLKELAICETSFFVESIDEMTRLAYRNIDCVACLQRAIAASEQRTSVIRDLLAKVEAEVKWCRVYDTECINPTFCDARDACCAGDPDCTPLKRKSAAP